MFRPFAALSTVVLLALGTNVRAADDQPKDVIERAIKAHGGEEVLTKNKAGKAKGKGKITLPVVGEVEFTQETAHMAPDKFKESLEMSIMGQNLSLITLVNGDKFTIEANGTEVPLDDETKATVKNAGYMIQVSKLVPLLKEKGYELSLIGEDMVGDKPAVGIRVTMKDKKDISLYFDKKTNLLVKLAYRSIDPFTKNEITEERIIAEYGKSKDGLPVPKKITVNHDSKKFLEIELSEVESFEKLDDSEFKK